MSIEHKFIDWVKETCQPTTRPAHQPVVLGVGDDAAVIDHGDQLTVVSTDLIADKVHFVLGETPNHLIGRKALAVNLSDLAAMAAKPVSVVVSLLLPRTMELGQAKEIFGGLKELADLFSIAIVGGDTNCHDGGLVINCAVTGVVPQDRDVANTWNMSAASPGDVVLVSGDLGNSIAGKHLSFEPKVNLAQYLAKHYQIHAATDISDSLTVDLAAIARKSGCGVSINLIDIPVSVSAQELEGDVSVGENGTLKVSAGVASALFDGEDFELAITVNPETAEKILTDIDCLGAMNRVGTITSSQGIRLVDDDGHEIEIQPRGYEH